MAADIFIKMDGIKGQSTDHKHKDEIELQSWQFGVSKPVSMNSGGIMSAGKANYSEIVCSCESSKASALLVEHAGTAKKISKVTLTNRDATGTQEPYLIVTLDDAYITAYSVSSGSGGDRPHESFSLVYAKIKIESKERKANGSVVNGTEFTYILTENKKA